MIVRRPRFFAFLVVAGSLALAQLPAGSAFAQANNDFFGNLFKPPGQVRSGNQAPADTGGDDGTVGMRMDRLENQLRQITGQLEQMQYRNQQLEQQIRQLQSEIDFRLGGAGGGSAGAAPRPGNAPAAAPGGVPPIMDPAPARRSDAFDPNAQAGAPGAPRPLGTTQPSGGTGAPMDLGALSGQAAAGGALIGASTGGASGSPKEMFDLAYGYMLQQNYAQSGQSFEQFIKLYPNDRATPDAYYWLGETQFQRKTYKEAAQSFLKVSTDYPNAVKAPDALLRLGQSLAAIGEKDAACATLNAVNNKYPRASATIKQGVEREQKRAGC